MGQTWAIGSNFRKAFDKVSHGRLLSKVKSHGVQAAAAKWIQNWLDDSLIEDLSAY